MNMIQNDINRDNKNKKNGRNRTRKMNNYELVAREQDLPLLPQRPPSISPVVGETQFNYMDTVRSYGSAADELETLPRIPHDYIQNIQKPVATVAPSLISDRDMNLKDNYFRKKSPGLDSTRPSSSSSIFFRQAKLRVNLPQDVGGDDTCQSELSMEDEYQRYHWDCSDWANQATLPALSELPNGEVVDHASWLSELHRNISSTNTIQPFNINEPVDPTRDIETLPEEDNVVSVASNDDQAHVGDGSDNESQLGAVYPDSPMHQTNKSIEELMLANGVNYADDEDDNSEEIPNIYDYKLHLNNYLPTYHLGSDQETDEAATPMLNGRTDRSMHMTNTGAGYPSPSRGNYNIHGRTNGIKSQPSIYPTRGATTATSPSTMLGLQQNNSSDSEDRLCVLEDLPADPSDADQSRFNPNGTDESEITISQAMRTPSPRVTQV